MKEEKSELLNENNINCNKNNINNKFNYIYEMLFGIVSNIIQDKSKIETKLKQYKILEKIISNIISSEKNKINSEKFRKIRINNPNINLILKIKGVYDFFIFLGFKQKKDENDENNTYLFLPEENISLQKLEKSLFYMNLLNLNFIEDNDEDNLNYIETPEYEEKKKESRTIIELIPKTNINTSDNNDAQNILKETGQERYNQALKNSVDNNNYFSFKSVFNFFTCKNCGKDPKKEAKDFFEKKKQKNIDKKNIMTLEDFKYKNPSTLKI